MTPPFPREDWAELLPFLKEDTRKDVVYLVREFINIIVSFFQGQLIVALGQGLLFAIGFALVGLQQGFIIGLLLGYTPDRISRSILEASESQIHHRNRLTPWPPSPL